MTHENLQRGADQREPLLSHLVTDDVAVGPGEDVVLLQTMRLAVAADGAINDREMATLAALSRVLPQLRSKDQGEISALLRLPLDTAEYARRAARMPPALRAQCFAIAVDLVLASGDRASALDATLAALRGALQIAPAQAAALIGTIAVKYGRDRRDARG